MVGVDAADDRRHLGLGVVVGVHRVVDEAGADRAVAQRRSCRGCSRRRPTGRGRRSSAGRRSPSGWSRADCRVIALGRRRRLARGVLLVVRPGGVLRGLVGRRLGLARSTWWARVDQGERQVVREGGAVGAGLDLHVVDLADEHRLGAGAGVGRLRAAGVRSVLVVVLQGPPSRSTRRRCGCAPAGRSGPRRGPRRAPGDADRGEPGDGLRLADHPGVGGAAGDGPALEAGEAAVGAGERHLGHGGFTGAGRHGGRHQLGRRGLAADGAGGSAARGSADDVEARPHRRRA